MRGYSAGSLRAERGGQGQSERVEAEGGEDRQRRHRDTDAAGEERRWTVSFPNTTAPGNTDG